jgi:large subunit ribosomal protein L15
VNLHSLRPADGSVKARRRVGRGLGSGRGKTAGRGHKGQNSRSGGGVRRGFEGGQMPLYMRVPKFGFTNIHRRAYVTVNVGQLVAKFAPEEEVTPEKLAEAGLVNMPKTGEGHFGGPVGIKILGTGDLDRALTVRAHAFSETARAKIETAGGKAEVI